MKSFIVVSCSKTTRAVHQMPNNSMAGMPVPSVAQATIRCAISASPTLISDAAALSGRDRPGETTVMPNAILAFFTLAATLAYLGLAILGWGGFAAFFSHPARIALAVVTFALSGAALFTRGNLSPGVREDRANRWVIAAFGVLGLLAAYLPAYTDRKGIWVIDGNAVRWLGVALFAAGGALRIWPVFVLGHRFSGLVAIQPGHTLVTSGVYGIIRNPSYLGMFINSLGWALAFRSGVGMLLTALLIPPLVARMRAEERLLRSQFGDEYEAYCARTSRLIPGVY
ncbi:MAG: methyltransferase family protein [Xanthobacteraceae bacterium]